MRHVHVDYGRIGNLRFCEEVLAAVPNARVRTVHPSQPENHGVMEIGTSHAFGNILALSSILRATLIYYVMPTKQTGSQG